MNIPKCPLCGDEVQQDFDSGVYCVIYKCSYASHASAHDQLCEQAAKARAWDRQSEWYQNACDGESPSDGRRERWIIEERERGGLS